MKPIERARVLIKRFSQEIDFYRIVLKHPGTPRASRFFLGAAIAYAVSPIDLIPDFIPVIGILDDVIVLSMWWISRKRWPQGYYMPPVLEIYRRHADLLSETTVIRLHGPDRGAIEGRTGKEWNRIAEPREADLDALAEVVKGLQKRQRDVGVFANNHFEGCAPLTLDRLKQRLGK